MIGRKPDHCRESEGEAALVSRVAGRRAVVVLHLLALIAVVTELVLPPDHDGHGVERFGGLDFPASYALYGFTACVALVLLGRWLRRAVMRHEDYYDGDR